MWWIQISYWWRQRSFFSSKIAVRSKQWCGLNFQRLWLMTTIWSEKTLRSCASVNEMVKTRKTIKKQWASKKKYYRNCELRNQKITQNSSRLRNQMEEVTICFISFIKNKSSRYAVQNLVLILSTFVESSTKYHLLLFRLLHQLGSQNYRMK